MCVYPADAPTLSHPAWPCLFSLLMGVTNGYFGSVPMIQAAGKVPPEQRELAGTSFSSPWANHCTQRNINCIYTVLCKLAFTHSYPGGRGCHAKCHLLAPTNSWKASRSLWRFSTKDILTWRVKEAGIESLQCLTHAITWVIAFLLMFIFCVKSYCTLKNIWK